MTSVLLIPCLAIFIQPLGSLAEINMSESWHEQVGSFIQCNFDGYVTIVPVFSGESLTRWHGLQEKEAQKLTMALSKQNYQRTRLWGWQFGGLENAALPNGFPGAPAMVPGTDLTIFLITHYPVTGLYEIVLEVYLLISSLTSTRRSLLIFSGNIDAFWTILRNITFVQDRSSHFFMIHISRNQSIYWYQIITVKGKKQVVANFLEFTKDFCIKEAYNLDGLVISSISLTFVPYITIDGCDQEGRNCEDYFGTHVDLAGILGEELNMTIDTQRQVDGDWGVSPKKGPHDLTGEWGGVMGKVINGEFAMSLCDWFYIIERFGLMDFALVHFDHMFLVLTPQPAKLDFHLFLRPFQSDTWIHILTIFFIMILTSYLVRFCLSHEFESSEAFKTVSLVSMLFFVLINAFYGGAMTMFFASSIKLPFEDRRDVLRDNSWSLIVQKGSEVIYQVEKDDGDHDYIKLWERMQEQPDLTLFPDVGTGLRMIKEDRNVMHVFRSPMQSYFRDKLFHTQELHIFGHERPLYMGLIFTKNSPLTAVFKHALLRLREKGVIQQTYAQWEGRELRQEENTMSKTTLTTGQVILVFLLMSVSITLALVALVGECILKAKRKKAKNFKIWP